MSRNIDSRKGEMMGSVHKLIIKVCYTYWESTRDSVSNELLDRMDSLEHKVEARCEAYKT